MSKNHSLDIKTIYQSGLVVILVVSLLIICLNLYRVITLFNKPSAEPGLKIREQQLKQAIQIIDPSNLEN